MHDDTKKLYAEVREVREEMLDDALDVILGGHTRPAAAASSLNELVVYNTTSFAWREVVWVPLAGGNSALRTQVAQLAADGKEGYALVHVAYRPNFWDAWDVDIHYLEKAKQVEFSKASIVAQDPLRVSVRAELDSPRSPESPSIPFAHPHPRIGTFTFSAHLVPWP
ncbi:hypothetical protein C8F04DRAFT_1262635 [Mycena alexandri]|uniref:Uncharacterized protein n=1 Tax=Mycena alexandri TaxID=1745969 RepID=A0AAD6X0Z1_9AGAR|nr:hypothetical protein C8F04DRAFT_1268585 [Mycena alexandri]KAJ7031775.1 hypothetical protein C8F04DRAFT_1262635 [Mycena alexandri]